MASRLVFLTKQAEVAAIVKRGVDRIKKAVVDRLCYIGEAACKAAKEKGSYRDITGNLRASIGYMVLLDGKEAGVFQPSGNAPRGAAAAKALLESLKDEFPTGAVLILCAGMSYAAYVENVHHRDVLASGTLVVEQLSEQLLRQL